MSKLESLKQILEDKKLDFIIIPMRDEFGCEYVPPQGKRIEYLTGFTGSNALVIAGTKTAAFFTDGRYTLQASMEVDQSEYEIYEMTEKDHFDWLKEHCINSAVIGYNPALFSIETVNKLKEFCQKNNKELRELNEDLIDQIWQEKPKPDYSKAFKIDEENRVNKVINKIDADFLLETDPENICWLLNIRGKDLAYTPVILTYMLLSKKGEIILFSDNESLKETGYKVKKLSKIEEIFKNMRGKKIQLDESNCPEKFNIILKNSDADIQYVKSPIIEEKAIKTEPEIEHVKQAHIADGIALSMFFRWLEKELKNNKLYTEHELSEQLSEFRKKHPAFYSLSFDAIVGFKSNGAIIHYRPDEKKSAKLEGQGMLLIDSGAQYYGNNMCGTTDITRTIYIGTPTKEQKRNYTLVLKGHIAVANAKFEQGSCGIELDVLARKFLKEEEKDYKHGTGHGVGYFLNVHEGPHAINSRNKVALIPGMIISNEPGYYKEGEYGIRIESLVYVKKSQEPGFLELETLSMAPIDLKLIDYDILNEDEINWLNNYHKAVYEQLSKCMNEEEKSWLKEKTKAV